MPLFLPKWLRPPKKKKNAFEPGLLGDTLDAVSSSSPFSVVCWFELGTRSPFSILEPSRTVKSLEVPNAITAVSDKKFGFRLRKINENDPFF